MDLKSSSPRGRAGREFGVMFLLLAVLISLLFGITWLPGHTLFSNDGPLGRLVSECHRLPDAFSGVWEDLNTIGYREQGALPDITYGLRLVLGPVLFSKFYVPVALTSFSEAGRVVLFSPMRTRPGRVHSRRAGRDA